MDGILTQKDQFSMKKSLQKIADVGLQNGLGQSDPLCRSTRKTDFDSRSRTASVSHRRLLRAIYPSA